MYIPFDQLKSDSRIWIFQSNRILTSQEAAETEKMLHAFTSKWAAHGNPLASSYRLMNNCHVIVGVDLDYNQASGCSIDTLTHSIREIGEKFNVDFFDRRAVVFCMDNEIFVKPFEEVKGLIAQGSFTAETPIYNNLVAEKGQLETDWKVRAGESWLKRYFTKNAITT